MKIVRHFILLSIFFFYPVIGCFAQEAAGGLNVPVDSLSLAQLLRQYDQSITGIAQVDLLNRISGTYWYQGKPTSMDSCILYAKKAYKIGTTLHYNSGTGQTIFLLCKAYTRANDLKSAVQLINLVYGEQRVRLLLIIGEFYLFQDNDKVNLTKTYSYIIQAKNLSDSLKSTPWRYESLMLYFTMGDIQKGKSSIMEIINDCIKLKNVNLEAHYWSELGLYLPETDSTYKEKIQFHQMAYKRYLQANALEDAAYSLRDIADLNRNWRTTRLLLPYPAWIRYRQGSKSQKC